MGAEMSESVLGKLGERLAGEGRALCAWVTMNEPAVAEALAREAFDAIVLDMQHGAIDFDGAMRSILAVALAGKPTIARVPVGGFALASQLMDAGAGGILAPMINSGEDARRLVEFVKFPPLGQRSWGPRAALPLSGLDAPAYLTAANAMTQAIAMIETRAALDALDDILSVEGLDGVYVGPSDLSIALSNGRAVEPRGAEVMAEARRVVERAKAHRKYAAMFCFDGADARAMQALGYRLCTIASDQALLRSAARSELAAARSG
jgi:4-hydroxy-2-oxoheptanedioate aldolase